MATLVHNDPSPLLGNGLPNPRHVNPNLYTELGLVTLALALVMLGGAWFRKRLVIGIAWPSTGCRSSTSTTGASDVPFIMIGAWYLVRAYRLSQKLKMAKAGDAPVLGPEPEPRRRPTSATRRPARRPGRAPKSKPAKGTEAG